MGGEEGYRWRGGVWVERRGIGVEVRSIGVKRS
jgi:hypothetical protein